MSKFLFLVHYQEAHLLNCLVVKVKNKKFFGVVIDRNLRFDEYNLKHYKKAIRKLSVLVRLFKFMTNERRRMMLKLFIESQFRYCRLVWMYCNERALQSISIHHRNIRLLGIELYKIRNDISSHIMNELFEQ